MYDPFAPNRLSRTVAPAALVSTADAKAFLRVEISDDDSLIDDLVAAAAEHLDGRRGMLGRALLTQTWAWTLDDFPCETWADPYAGIRVPLPPLQSVSSIKYLDGNGDSQTLGTSVYAVNTGSEPGVISLKKGQSWPSVQDVRDAVTITFIAGYGDTASSLPASLRLAALQLVSAWYDNRSAVVIGTISSTLPMAVERLIAPYKVHV
ncbi:MAG: head-tail connector protein [Minwuia sp.]|nr:head-tail connector protein [Minwuia sp.]